LYEQVTVDPEAEQSVRTLRLCSMSRMEDEPAVTLEPPIVAVALVNSMLPKSPNGTKLHELPVHSSKSSTIHSASCSQSSSTSRVKVLETDLPVVKLSIVALPALLLVAVTVILIESPSFTARLKETESAGYHSYQASYSPSIHSKPVWRMAVPVTEVTSVEVITPPAQFELYETKEPFLTVSARPEAIFGPVLRVFPSALASLRDSRDAWRRAAPLGEAKAAPAKRAALKTAENFILTVEELLLLIWELARVLKLKKRVA